jgi:hypothetical protein
MTVEHNLFSSPPASLTNDESLAQLRNQLHPREYYYCGTHFLAIVDADRNVNFSVGSTKRYILVKECSVCGDDSLFVVLAK